MQEELIPIKGEKLTADEWVDAYSAVEFPTLGEIANVAFELSNADFERVCVQLGWEELITNDPQLLEIITDAQSRRLDAS